MKYIQNFYLLSLFTRILENLWSDAFSLSSKFWQIKSTTSPVVWIELEKQSNSKLLRLKWFSIYA